MQNQVVSRPDKRRLFGERMAVSLLLAAVLLAAMGSLRPDKPHGMSPNAYWAEKINWRHCANMVIMGDSRSYMGISPAILSDYFVDMRIRNFGFNGNGYTPEYLQAATEVLDSQLPHRTILLAITPASLLRSATIDNQFLELKTKKSSCLLRYCKKRFPEFWDFFEPMSFRDAWFGLCPSAKPTHSSMEYFTDGWLAMEHSPVSHREIRKYQNSFSTNHVDPKVEAMLLDQVRQWRDDGVNVYAFRMPAHPKMIDLENTASGFDETAFIRDFQAAGGVWIKVNPAAYDSYDGSHLSRAAAIRFSHDLGRLLANQDRLTRNR